MTAWDSQAHGEQGVQAVTRETGTQEGDPLSLRLAVGGVCPDGGKGSL